MLNTNLRTEGNKLIIEVDLTQTFGPSSSGKTIIVASTQGNVSAPDHPDIKVGLNVYTYPNR